MIRLRHIVAAGCLIVLSAIPLRATEAQLDWLAGAWCSDNGKVFSQEVWQQPQFGLMLATNLQYNREKNRSSFEYMRIDSRGEKTQFFAQPMGTAAVAFELVQSAEQMLRFENPQHDYPQFIQYQRQGTELVATIGRLDDPDSNSQWRWQPCESLINSVIDG